MDLLFLNSIYIDSDLSIGNPFEIHWGGASTSGRPRLFIQNSLLSFDKSAIRNNHQTAVVTWGTDNITSNAGFVDFSADNYKLNRTSLALGGGVSSFQFAGNTYQAPAKDIQGNPRPNPSGTSPDIGAHESALAETIPIASQVFDGVPSDTVELDYIGPRSSLSAYWNQFISNSQLTYYYALGSAGLNDIIDWTSSGSDTTITVNGLNLINDINYRFSIYAVTPEGVS